MPACEYCGEHYPKGGAYSTHVRHCDERPQPDEEEDAQNDEAEQPEPESGDNAPDDQDDPNTIQMTEDEFDEILSSVEEEARASALEEGIEQGYEAGLEEGLERGAETTDESETASQGDETVSCVHCGRDLGVTLEEARREIDAGKNRCKYCNGVLAYT